MKAFLPEAYGKFHDSHMSEYVIFENINFVETVKDYLPSNYDNPDFKNWLTLNPDVIYHGVDLFLMTVPNPRYEYYQSSDTETIERNLVSYTNEVVEALGFFPIFTQLPLLEAVKVYSFLILFIGLVANILIILFIIIAILLIYSLLMISIETKTFEFGVMRLTGLSSSGLISLITIQAILFVLPALLSAFILSVPGLATIYYYLVSSANGYSALPIPSGSASLIAIALGIFIPAVSSIIPVRRALGKNLSESLSI